MVRDIMRVHTWHHRHQPLEDMLQTLAAAASGHQSVCAPISSAARLAPADLTAAQSVARKLLKDMAVLRKVRHCRNKLKHS